MTRGRWLFLGALVAVAVVALAVVPAEVGLLLLTAATMWAVHKAPELLTATQLFPTTQWPVTARAHLTALARDLGLAADGDTARGRVVGVPIQLRASREGLHVRLDVEGHRLQLGPSGDGHRLGVWRLHSPPRTLDGLPHDLLATRSSAGWAVWAGAVHTVSAHAATSDEVGLPRVVDMVHVAALLRGDGARFWQRLTEAEVHGIEVRAHALSRVLAEPPSDDVDRTWRAAVSSDLRPYALAAASGPLGQRYRDVLRAEVDRGAPLDPPELLVALAAHATSDDVARLGEALQRTDTTGARAALAALVHLGDPDAIDAIDLARRRWTGPLADAAASAREALVAGARQRDGGRLTTTSSGRGNLTTPGGS